MSRSFAASTPVVVVPPSRPDAGSKLAFFAVPRITGVNRPASAGSPSSTSAAGPGGGGRGGRGRGGDAGAAPVVTAKASEKDVPVDLAAIGNVEAYASISIRSQITGQLQDVAFHEGDVVKQGDL